MAKWMSYFKRALGLFFGKSVLLAGFILMCVIIHCWALPLSREALRQRFARQLQDFSVPCDEDGRVLDCPAGWASDNVAKCRRLEVVSQNASGAVRACANQRGGRLMSLSLRPDGRAVVESNLLLALTVGLLVSRVWLGQVISSSGSSILNTNLEANVCVQLSMAQIPFEVSSVECNASGPLPFICEIDVTSCNCREQCENDALCLAEGVRRRRCVCMDGFSGRRCEKVDVTPAATTTAVSLSASTTQASTTAATESVTTQDATTVTVAATTVSVPRPHASPTAAPMTTITVSSTTTSHATEEPNTSKTMTGLTSSVTSSLSTTAVGKDSRHQWKDSKPPNASSSKHERRRWHTQYRTDSSSSSSSSDDEDERIRIDSKRE